MSNEIRLSGFKEFGDKLKNLPGKLQTTVDSYVYDAAKQWEQLAKNTAPVDQNALRRGITARRTGNMTAEVTSNAQHSRYVEWGTKGKKIVPSEMVAYESSLGYVKSGDYYDFLNNILDWVKRKGISSITNSYTGKKVTGKAAKENLLVAAEAIAWSIMKKGINPHPFFFIHKPGIEKSLFARIQKKLETPQ